MKLLSTGLFVSIIILSAGCRQEGYWERTLIGPFQGEVYQGLLTTTPTSTIKLSASLELELHWVSMINDPVICLRRTDGTFAWARVLVPHFQGQDQPRGQITQLSFDRISSYKDGCKVLFSCEWTGGGKENGIIYLDSNSGFKHFKLGW